jgi:hypothetical protein
VKDGSETSKRVLEPRCSESEEVFLWDGVEEILAKKPHILLSVVLER